LKCSTNIINVAFGQIAIFINFVMVSNIILSLGGSLCVNLSHNLSKKVLFGGIMCRK
jgi:hypothetical protein